PHQREQQSRCRAQLPPHHTKEHSRTSFHHCVQPCPAISPCGSAARQSHQRRDSNRSSQLFGGACTGKARQIIRCPVNQPSRQPAPSGRDLPCRQAQLARQRQHEFRAARLKIAHADVTSVCLSRRPHIIQP